MSPVCSVALEPQLSDGPQKNRDAVDAPAFCHCEAGSDVPRLFSVPGCLAGPGSAVARRVASTSGLLRVAALLAAARQGQGSDPLPGSPSRRTPDLSVVSPAPTAPGNPRPDVKSGDRTRWGTGATRAAITLRIRALSPLKVSHILTTGASKGNTCGFRTQRERGMSPFSQSCVAIGSMQSIQLTSLRPHDICTAVTTSSLVWLNTEEIRIFS